MIKLCMRTKYSEIMHHKESDNVFTRIANKIFGCQLLQPAKVDITLEINMATIILHLSKNIPRLNGKLMVPVVVA